MTVASCEGSASGEIRSRCGGRRSRRLVAVAAFPVPLSADAGRSLARRLILAYVSALL